MRAALAAAAALATLLGTAGAAAAPTRSALLPAGWSQIATGPAGGSVWQGVIRNPAQPTAFRPSLAYLPPEARAGRRYPLLVLLHGTPGSTYSIGNGLDFASYADEAIATGAAPPFIAIVPEVGLPGPPALFQGEWAGGPERYVMGPVLSWAEHTLPLEPGTATIAGLSAGGYGAVDIALRHPRLFRTAESWSGYFRPLPDGVFRGASRTFLDAHDPTLLVRREAPLLRRLGTRFYLSAGTTQDRESTRLARQFAAELRQLRLPVTVRLTPGGHDGAFWRSQLPAALAAAFPAV